MADTFSFEEAAQPAKGKTFSFEDAASTPNDWLSKIGLAGKAAFEGVAGLPMAAVDALDMPNSIGAKLAGVPYQSPSERLKAAGSATLDALGLRTDEPNTQGERLMQDTVRGTTGALSGGGAKSVGQAILQGLSGAAGGGAAGYTRERGGGPLAQIAAGLAGGLTVPLVAGAVAPIIQAGKNIIEPYMPAFGSGLSGQEQIIGRTANTAAGAAKNDIIPLLKEQKQIVPGSIPTAGEAAAPAGSPEFSALQMKADRLAPYAANARAQEQAGARNNALGTFAGTPESLDAAVATRGTNAAENYGNAFSQAVKVDPELAQIASNPYFEKAIPTALDLAKAAKIDPKTNVTQFLQYVKVGIDKQIAKTGEGALAGMEKGAAQDVKTQLVNWLGNKNPQFETARQGFIADSQPINQMQVGQYLQGKLNAPLTDIGADTPQRAAAYAQALRDAPGTIKNSGGRGIADNLPDAIGPQNAETATNVGLDLARRSEMERLARLGSPALEKQLNVIPMQVPGGPLDQTKSLINWALRGLSNKASDKSIGLLGDMARTNPNELARLMEMAPPAQQSNMLKILMSGSQGIPASMIGYRNQ